MRKLSTVIAAAALAVPGVALAQGHGSSTAAKNAAKECKALKSASATKANFASAVQTMTKSKVTQKNAYGKCVSIKTKQDAAQSKAARSNAARDCKAERKADPTAFQTTYGKNKNDKNAYGKCVSQKARANKAAADKKDKQKVNAAKTCRSQQKSDKAGFESAWGKKKNAFGKCVTKTARAKNA
jgi:hypothetical protein